MSRAPLEGQTASAPILGAERRAALGVDRGTLEVLAQRVRPTYLAQEELLPAPPPLAELIGTPGLRRGSTFLVEAVPGPSDRTRAAAAGATSLALSLLAEPTAAGASCAVVGLPDLGLLAAEELGVALERLVVVPAPGGRAAAVVGALLEGVDLVLARFAVQLPAATARRLSARARERRAVLVLAGPGVGEVSPTAGAPLPWPEVPDARLSVSATAWDPLEAAPGGLLAGRRLAIVARRRRAVPEEVRRTLLVTASPATPASGPTRLQLGLAPLAEEGAVHPPVLVPARQVAR